MLRKKTEDNHLLKLLILLNLFTLNSNGWDTLQALLFWSFDLDGPVKKNIDFLVRSLFKAFA